MLTHNNAETLDFSYLDLLMLDQQNQEINKVKWLESKASKEAEEASVTEVEEEASEIEAEEAVSEEETEVALEAEIEEDVS